MTNTFGGPQENAGRPHLDGSPAGEGEYAVRIQATMPASMREYIDAQPGSSFSARLRGIVEFHQSHASPLDKTINRE